MPENHKYASTCGMHGSLGSRSLGHWVTGWGGGGGHSMHTMPQDTQHLQSKDMKNATTSGPSL